ncbi:hypothetical protein MKW98_026087 [Papaver atlanticum]|uniref:HECT-type E3 ubiquitin transferase n=1 Tax=Papaver atlanticum TaxID=357466 RepID=A0AAD4X5U3_9MAGN|nr:hypothetical protein MKW98_026087 [Papaver atlanticum]
MRMMALELLGHRGCSKSLSNMLLETMSISWECFCRENRQPALQVLDIVLHELPTFRHAPVGCSFYFPNLWAEVTDYELIPGGRNIRVTEENKHEYVDLVAEHRLTTAIRPQINAFLEGFNELISRELISIFNDKELELLFSGLPDIDLDDMRANTEDSGYSSASPIIQWFWEVAQAFSKEDKARLLQFVTGTSKVPLEGFSALQGISDLQRFQIHKAYGSPNHLPSAHTCFNQLDLPEYPSKQHLEERLLLAIHEANEGFGFG